MARYDHDNWQDRGHCPRCGAYDYGYEKADCRAQYRAPKDGQPLDEDWITIQVVIEREPIPCPDCGIGTTFRAVYRVVPDDGSRKWLAPTQHAAEALLRAVWPDAKFDDDWLEIQREQEFMMRMGGQW